MSNIPAHCTAYEMYHTCNCDCISQDLQLASAEQRAEKAEAERDAAISEVSSIGRELGSVQSELEALKGSTCAVGTCLLCETTRHGGDVDAAKKAMGIER